MIAAIIVLYRPECSSVHRLIRSLEDQVDHIYVIDNTAFHETVPEEELFPPQITVPLHYKSLRTNLGIAAAQNIGIQEAIGAGASHVILFDQDSVPASGIVQELLSAEITLVKKGFSVAAVGPAYIDERTGGVSPVVRYSYIGLQTIPIDLTSPAAVEAHFLISSGCLIRSFVLSKVGLMREDLFIDWVDNEWGLRARSMGMLSYVVPQARMIHSIGDGVVKLLWKQMHLHTEARNYYLLRNAIYLMRVPSMGIRWKLSFLPRLPLYLAIYPLLAKHKTRHFATLLHAVYDGLSGHLGSMSIS
ncbi:MAG: glycosyltransferase family 2 protein [Terracidiphilus sp.]